MASVVGGSGVGSGSGSTRRGVAPGAWLLVGKVLGDDGFGSWSQVIAGMEWAVEQGADVVNMSLGSSGASDGTDPMSLALNDLSRRSGALFVVAAGNDGEQGPRTVGSPGAADAALTVGAVDRNDSLAPFSSRGPRRGDEAVKPDVTAPGVGIVAARAAGTAMGSPVDEHYVAASGTSMATPHVAGAAALLAQRHPEWTAARLKDALISSAVTVDGQKVTEQGGGRIDARAAVLGAVSATGTLALGPFTSEATNPRAPGSSTPTPPTRTGRLPGQHQLDRCCGRRPGAAPRGDPGGEGHQGHDRHPGRPGHRTGRDPHTPARRTARHPELPDVPGDRGPGADAGNDVLRQRRHWRAASATRMQLARHAARHGWL
ncbi:S8 family serine peptidase [Streptomyces globisporus]|uniref:S8 family serine peptidase n=1 Tax=Streptomyces globisporus TaxID=1908 RepID=UPI001FC93743|nr:S8 family serine peptidase [Streptomyces globisporus]